MKKNKEVNGFFLYIPIIIDKDKRLSTTERYLLLRMINLDNEKRCFANNSYLAKLLNCSLSTISRSIKYLQKLGYVPYNEPDKNRGGRGNLRHVREDLKYKKPEKSIEDSTPSKNTHVPSQNSSYICKGKKNYQKNENISIEEENKLVQNELDIPIPNKVDFYNKCKNEYNKLYAIVWDKEQVESLVDLCNKLFQSFKKDIGLKKKEISTNLLKLFVLVINHKPKFFTDSLPNTFVRFWNQVIQQNKFENSLSRFRMRISNRDEGFQ